MTTLNCAKAYSLNLFIQKRPDGNNGNFHTLAQSADSHDYGGNSNGFLDGDEIGVFESLVKTRYGYVFSFDGITPGSLDKMDKKLREQSLLNVRKQDEEIDQKLVYLENRTNQLQNILKEKFPNTYVVSFGNVKDGYEDSELRIFIKRDISLKQIKEDLGLDDKVLINQNPNLKELAEDKPNFFEYLQGKRPNYDNILLKKDVHSFVINLNSCKILNNK